MEADKHRQTPCLAHGWVSKYCVNAVCPASQQHYLCFIPIDALPARMPWPVISADDGGKFCNRHHLRSVFLLNMCAPALPGVLSPATQETFVRASVDALADFSETYPDQFSNRNMTMDDLKHVFSLVSFEILLGIHCEPCLLGIAAQQSCGWCHNNCTHYAMTRQLRQCIFSTSLLGHTTDGHVLLHTISTRGSLMTYLHLMACGSLLLIMMIAAPR